MPRQANFVLAPTLLVAAAMLVGLMGCMARRAPAPHAKPSATTRSWGTLAFAPCSLPGLLGRQGISARCAVFEVPEERGRPGGRTIGLKVAWVPATDEAELHPDPLLFIAGGPGQSALESYAKLAPAFEGIRAQRDILLVDQRGTGGSHRLDCALDDEKAAARPGEVAALAERCVAALAARADLRFYTTTDAVADLEELRRAIGATQLNLFGVSYGTRVAQKYAMRHPEATRSLVLDSVVPNAHYLGNLWGRNLDEALALQFAVCKRDPGCVDKLGDPHEELKTLVARLRTAPPVVSYRDPTSGELRREPLVADEVAGLVRMFAYMPPLAGLLPQQIRAANTGDLAGLKALAVFLKKAMRDEMASAMQLSVMCSEDGDRLHASAEDRDTLLGNQITDFLASACKVWPRGRVPADFHAPLASTVPALVLEGEFDPVTPPRNGEEVVRSLPNGRLLVLRGQGHNVIGAGCMPRLFAKFVESADAKGLDAGCLEALSYAQPFISYNGWSP